MHNPDYVHTTAPHLDQHSASLPGQELHIQFSAMDHRPPEQRRLAELIRDRTVERQFFYGIELTARYFGSDPLTLDYSSFGALLPLFTSLIWLGQDYAHVERVEQVEAVRWAQQLQPQTIVMPHFSCFRAGRERLDEFLALNFSNVLALRGDQVAPGQTFTHASDLVEEIRRLRGDSISIGVAGYPEGHPDARSLEEDMEYLKKKVDAGADFIITQVCFSSSAAVDFVKRCRTNGISVPILLGVFVPESMGILRRMSEITRVQVPASQLAEYEARAAKAMAFSEYAEVQAVRLIEAVLDSEVGVYGVQFFTMNRFKSVRRVLQAVVANKTHVNKV